MPPQCFEETKLITFGSCSTATGASQLTCAAAPSLILYAWFSSIGLPQLGHEMIITSLIPVLEFLRSHLLPIDHTISQLSSVPYRAFPHRTPT